MIRLNKYLSDCGVCSRRKADELILKGKVDVNGVTADELGIKVGPEDTVRVDGKEVKPTERKIYIMLNKPKGYISAVSDDRGRKTVLDLIGGIDERIYPVGRLDYDTTGLLILTNDGDFSYKMTHPKHNIVKTYVARLKKAPSAEKLQTLRNGVHIDGYFAKPKEVKIITSIKEYTDILISIGEGKNREVRKMFEKIGFDDIELKRIAIGSLRLNKLPTGKYKLLTKKEIASLEGLL